MNTIKQIRHEDAYLPLLDPAKLPKLKYFSPIRKFLPIYPVAKRFKRKFKEQCKNINLDDEIGFIPGK